MKSTTTNTIVRAGLVAGTLDIIAAILVNVVFKGQITATKLLQSIASGITGKAAYDGGAAAAALGLLLHYAIAFIFTIFYVLIYPKLRIAQTQPLLTGIIYGILVWTIMNVIVLPTAFSRPFVLNLGAQWVGILIIILCIGIPIALITNKLMGSRKALV